MVKEVKNLTNIRLTESDTDGIWLHFETAQGLAAGIALSSLLCNGDVISKTLETWAREQLDKIDKPVVRSKKFVQNAPRKLGTRPSPLVEGGY